MVMLTRNIDVSVARRQVRARYCWSDVKTPAMLAGRLPATLILGIVAGIF